MVCYAFDEEVSYHKLKTHFNIELIYQIIKYEIEKLPKAN